MSEGAKNLYFRPTGGMPFDYQSLLQQEADQKRVVEGAGGSVQVLTLEDTIIAPSNEGLGTLPGGQLVLTSDPKMAPPDLSNATIWAQEVGSTLINMLTGLPVDSTVTSLSQNTTNTDEELAYLQLAQELYVTGAENPPTDTTATTGATAGEISSSFETWLASFVSDLTPSSTTLTSKEQQTLQDLQSSDPTTVQAALEDLAKLKSLNLTGNQQVAVSSRLLKLATTIALANTTGGSWFMSLSVPELIVPILLGALDVTGDSSLKADQRAALTSALVNVSTGIGKLNFISLLKSADPSKEYTALTSQDPTQIAALLSAVFQTTGMVVQLPPGAMRQIISSLSEELAKLDPESFSSMGEADLTAALTTALASIDIPTSTKLALHGALIPLLKSEITNVCSENLALQLYSTNPSVTNKSLISLLDVDTDPSLHPAAKAVVTSYLKVLAQALAFLAQIRAAIASLEGTTTQNIAKAKLSQTTDQVINASKILATEFTKIQKTLAHTLKQISHAKLMRKLMPLLSVFAALAAVIIAVVFVVQAIVTLGAGATTAPAFGALIGAIVGLVVASATLTLAIADMACTMTGSHKSMWDRMAESAHLGPVMKALLVTLIQVIMDAVTIVTTLGIGTALVALKSGLDAAAKVLPVALKATFNLTQSSGQMVVGTLITAIFSGGLITIGLTKLGKAIFGNDKDGGAFAMAMSIFLMLLITLITSAAGSLAKGGANLLKAIKTAIGGGKAEAGELAKETVTEVGEGVKQGAAGMTPTKALENGARTVVDHMKDFLRWIGGKTNLKDAADMTLPQCIEAMGQLILEITGQLAKNFYRYLKDTVEGAARGFVGEAKSIGEGAYRVFYPSTLPANKFSERLKEFFEGISPYIGIGSLEAVRITTDGLNMYASYCQYKQAKFSASFDKQMAVLESALGALQALMSIIQQLGPQATDTISKITDAANTEAKNWAGLVQLIESFINSASTRLTQLFSRG